MNVSFFFGFMLEYDKGCDCMDKNEFTLEQYRLNESRVIRDAIQGYITFEYLPIWQLIATAEVQRLRRIKQLGGTYMVFPSAEH